MSTKISVITVVFNDAKNIRQTIDSFFSQTWEDKELIVIDGASTDGTMDVVNEYKDRMAYCCSEKDNGIYDAMNKGIERATGDWIIFLNSGDYFASATSLEEVMTKGDVTADVLFGDSIEVDDVKERLMVASPDTSRLEYAPSFRHGSALVKASIQKAHPFDLSKRGELGYALDWEMLYRLYKEGSRFAKVDAVVEAYRVGGVSGHKYKNLWYNYKITSQGKTDAKKLLFFAKGVVRNWLKGSILYRWTKAFVMEFMVNDILPHLTSWTMRRAYLRLLGAKIGKGTFIHKKTQFINPNLVTIGEDSHINSGCFIDARGRITIGRSVSVSHKVNIITGSHDHQNPRFPGVFEPIVIDDYAWLGIGSTILQGVTIGRGAVVCAGAVVTKDVAPCTVVGGVPAKEIRQRTDSFDYKCKGAYPFT